jgi:hypothetical protein
MLRSPPQPFGRRDGRYGFILSDHLCGSPWQARGNEQCMIVECIGMGTLILLGQDGPFICGELHHTHAAGWISAAQCVSAGDAGPEVGLGAK